MLPVLKYPGYERPSMPRLPDIREAITGVPMRAASEMTFAPPSMRELTTRTWLEAIQRKAFSCGTLPSQR